MARSPMPVKGAILGLLAGMFFCLIALALFIIRGQAMFDRLGVTLLGVCFLYLGSGTAAGLIVGLMRPWTERWCASVLCGMIAALPAYLGAAVMIGGNLFAIGVGGIVIGGVVGYRWWAED
jgi:hypothetical protein